MKCFITYFYYAILPKVIHGKMMLKLSWKSLKWIGNEFHVLLYSTITSTNVNNTNAYVMYLNALR